MRKLSAFVLVGVLGCAHQDESMSAPLKVRIDIQEPSRKDMVLEAADKWNAFSLKPIQIVDKGPVDYSVESLDPPEGYDGWTCRDGFDKQGTISVRTGVPDWRVFWIMLHEFGHGLGLGHTHQGIMCGVPYRCEFTDGFSDEDVVEMKRAGVYR